MATAVVHVEVLLIHRENLTPEQVKEAILDALSDVPGESVAARIISGTVDRVPLGTEEWGWLR